MVVPHSGESSEGEHLGNVSRSLIVPPGLPWSHPLLAIPPDITMGNEPSSQKRKPADNGGHIVEGFEPEPGSAQAYKQAAKSTKKTDNWAKDGKKKGNK